MKKILIIFAVLLLTGCTTKYNLKFENDKITEEITNYVYDTDYETPVKGIEDDNPVIDLIENDQYPIVNNTEKKYNKEIKDIEDYKEIKLTYEYSFDEFKSANSIVNCFENHKIIEEKKYYYLKLSGNFYCLYDDSIEININTPNKVLSSNGTKKSIGNYLWTIDENNYADTNIEIKISKDSMIKQYIIYGIIGLIVLSIIVFVFWIINKLSNTESVNEI